MDGARVAILVNCMGLHNTRPTDTEHHEERDVHAIIRSSLDFCNSTPMLTLITLITVHKILIVLILLSPNLFPACFLSMLTLIAH
jgi:hypothetical protein